MAAPWEKYAAPSAGESGPWAKYGGGGEAPEPAPQGALQNALAPIKNIPGEYTKQVHQSADQVGRGVAQMGESVDQFKQGNYLDAAKDAALGAGKAALGGLGYVTAPINAPVHALIGQPVQNVTSAATGSEKAGEFAGNLADVAATFAVPGPKMAPASANAGDEIARASQRLGVPIPRAAATDSIPVKASAGAVAQIPVVGTPLVKASKDATTGLDNAARNVATSYGEPERFAAGTSAKGGLVNWITDKSRDIADRVYGNVDQHINPNFSAPLGETRKAVQGILGERGQAFLPSGKAVDMVSDAIKPASTLTYEGVKRLRTAVGEALDGGIVPEGMSKGDLKRIYGALTSDLRANVAQSGGAKAVDAFDKANRLFEQIAARRSTLAKIVGTDGGAQPEAVLDRLISMASASRGGDLSKLSQARKAIGAEGWNDVAAAAVNKLGRASPEADFSGERFLTAWGNLSPAGKQLLFKSTGKADLASALDDIATLSKAHKSLMQFGNPSGTGRAVTFTGMAGAMWANPIATLSGALGGYGMARIFASPVAAKSTAKWLSAVNKAAKSSSPARIALVMGATRNLVNNLADLGISGDGLRSLSGQAPAHADNQEQKDVPAIGRYEPNGR